MNCEVGDKIECVSIYNRNLYKRTIAIITKVEERGIFIHGVDEQGYEISGLVFYKDIDVNNKRKVGSYFYLLSKKMTFRK